MFPAGRRSCKRQQHYTQGLLYKVMEDGLRSLGTNELRELYSHDEALRELHGWLWSNGPK
jgi:hypothetical protein